MMTTVVISLETHGITGFEVVTRSRDMPKAKAVFGSAGRIVPARIAALPCGGRLGKPAATPSLDENAIANVHVPKGKNRSSAAARAVTHRRDRNSFVDLHGASFSAVNTRHVVTAVSGVNAS